MQRNESTANTNKLEEISAMNLSRLVELLFSIYELLIFIRIFTSWLGGDIAAHPWLLQIGVWTDPYLALFRHLVPPLGGVLDLSPTLALLALHFARRRIMPIFY